MLNNKEEQLSERELAYTAPVDSDTPSSFQFHSDLMPQPAMQRKPAERSRRKLALALVCIIIRSY